MKLGDIPAPTKKTRPFFKDKDLEISSSCNEHNMYTQFKCVYKGIEKVFPISNNNIVEAWRKLEEFLRVQMSK